MATVIATTMINDTNHATQSIRLNIGSRARGDESLKTNDNSEFARLNYRLFPMATDYAA
jgi:hypothetical protein